MSKNGVLPSEWGWNRPQPERERHENAVAFRHQVTSLIVAVLSCFDRVIFKGYLSITNGPALEGFVDHILKIRRMDFMDFAQEQSQQQSARVPSAADADSGIALAGNTVFTVSARVIPSKKRAQLFP